MTHEKPWVCYLLVSDSTDQTYVGASNDAVKRLRTHNRGAGAKRTKGQTWSHVLIVNGFDSKHACLSFEAGWKRLGRNRSKKRFGHLESRSLIELTYTNHSVWNRLLDLLYFVHQFNYIGTKFVVRKDLVGQSKPDELTIDYMYDLDCVDDMPWPDFISVQNP